MRGATLHHFRAFVAQRASTGFADFAWAFDAEGLD
jgi:hypothetical protein